MQPPRTTLDQARRPLYPPLLALLAASVWVAGGAPSYAEIPCASCHEDQVKAVASGPHAAVATGLRFCTSCHGDGAKHIESGEAADIIGKAALQATPPAERSRACLTCHASRWTSWEASPHARSGEVSCWTCHANAAHFAQPIAAERRGGTTCAPCHAAAMSEFRRAYRHPVLEGRMGCTSCHNLHGDALAADSGEVCANCHTNVAGPYVFPHKAVDEGCVTCHAPHGSVNRSLLVTSGNGVCLSCHLQSNFPAVGKAVHSFRLAGGAKCFDCHSEVHGSNVDELLAPRFRR